MTGSILNIYNVYISPPTKHLFILQQHEPWEKKKVAAIIYFFQSEEVNMQLSHLLHQTDAIYLVA